MRRIAWWRAAAPTRPRAQRGNRSFKDSKFGVAAQLYDAALAKHGRDPFAGRDVSVLHSNVAAAHMEMHSCVRVRALSLCVSVCVSVCVVAVAGGRQGPTACMRLFHVAVLDVCPGTID